MCQLDSVAPTLERVCFLIDDDDYYTSHGSGRGEMVAMSAAHGGRRVGTVEFV